MANVREYLRKKADRKETTEKKKNFGDLIRKHRLAVISRTLISVAVLLLILAVVTIQLKNQVFTSYVTLSSVEKQEYDSSSYMVYANGFLTYSKDGISYTDSKGNAQWNQTYEMQQPLVKTRKSRVAVCDYNGHIVYNIDASGNVIQIDTNLPIKSFDLAANGMVAVVLEDTGVTWINIYNSEGTKIAYVKSTMAKSGYPVNLSLSENGELMAVSYFYVDTGTIKSSVAFYNFGAVGQNSIDNLASSYDYQNAFVPYLYFMNQDTAFAVADNRLMLFSGDQKPKSVVDVLLDEEIQSVCYSENYIGLVFLNTTEEGRYRIDIYSKEGVKILSKIFNIDYKEILFYKDNMIIYNDTECMMTNMRGVERFSGELEKPVLLLVPQSGKKFLAVTKESLDIIELK